MRMAVLFFMMAAVGVHSQSLLPVDTWKILDRETAEAVSTNSKDIPALRTAAYFYYVDAGRLLDATASADRAERRALAERMNKLITRAYRLNPKDFATILAYGRFSSMYILGSSVDGKKWDLNTAIRYSSQATAAFTKAKQLQPDSLEARAYSVMADLQLPQNIRVGVNEAIGADLDAFFDLAGKASFSGPEERYLKALEAAMYIAKAELRRRAGDRAGAASSLDQVDLSILRDPVFAPVITIGDYYERVARAVR